MSTLWEWRACVEEMREGLAQSLCTATDRGGAAGAGQAELDAKKQRLVLEKQQGEQDKMINYIQEEIGFADGKPVAATIIFRSLLGWRSFEAERTDIFDRVIQASAPPSAAPGGRWCRPEAPPKTSSRCLVTWPGECARS